MRQFSVYSLIALGIPLFGMAGCNHATEFDSANTQAVEQEGGSQASVNSEVSAPDDPKSLAAIESYGAKLNRNAQGRVFEVSFRDTSVDNSAMDHLAGLPELRILLLSDTGVTDVGLAAIGHSSGEIIRHAERPLRIRDTRTR